MSDEEIDIVRVIKLPLPMNAFVGLMKGLQHEYTEKLFIRNCPEGYEVFKERTKPKSE